MAEPALDPRPGARAARALRIRYAVLGVVLAGLWVGHSGEPAWEHALRTVLVLLTIRPLLRLTVKSRMRRGWSQTSTSRQVMWLVAFRLAVVGAALGVSWLVGDLLDPAHRHGGVHALVVRLLVLALTIPLQLRLERGYLGRGLGGAAGLRLSWGRFVSAKVALVLAALGAEVLLQRWLGGRADLVVAAGMLVTVAALGPWAHRRYFVRASPPRNRGVRPPDPPGETASPDPRGELSRGNVQRALVAQALVGPPELVVLDEPSGGLDRDGIGGLTAEIHRAAGRSSVVLVARHPTAPLPARAAWRIAGGVVRTEDRAADTVSVMEVETDDGQVRQVSELELPTVLRAALDVGLAVRRVQPVGWATVPVMDPAADLVATPAPRRASGLRRIFHGAVYRASRTPRTTRPCSSR